MSNMEQQQQLERLQEVLDKAVKKLGLAKESEVCRYIPVPTGGYIHHFTMRKMKYENPEQLLTMVKKFILDNASIPPLVEPKKRAPRGSRKALGGFPLAKHQFEKLLHMARLMGDKEIIKMLSHRTNDRKAIKRELIAAIKEDRADHTLWNSWVEIVEEQGAASLAVENGMQNLAM